MAADVNKHRPFHAHFVFEVLSWHNTEDEARDKEQAVISARQLQSGSGYNTLSGTPGKSAQYYAMAAQQRNRKWKMLCRA
eukprot:gene8181-8372_t